eukprot:2466378-Rhodomonas_salina.1
MQNATAPVQFAPGLQRIAFDFAARAQNSRPTPHVACQHVTARNQTTLPRPPGTNCTESVFFSV